MRAASLWRRALAVGIDSGTALVAIAVGFLFGAFDASVFRPEPGWFWTEWALRYWLDAPHTYVRPIAAWLVLSASWVLGWELVSGRTPGDRLLRLEVVDRDGDPPHPARIGLRALGVAVNIATLGLGWLWAFVSPSRRALHDVISGTTVALHED